MPTRWPIFQGADHINAPHRLVTRDARPFDRKRTFDSEGIRMADPARLKANADMAGVRIQQWVLCQFELARANHMYCAIRDPACIIVTSLATFRVVGRA
jgi:hypothetical protein